MGRCRLARQRRRCRRRDQRDGCAGRKVLHAQRGWVDLVDGGGGKVGGHVGRHDDAAEDLGVSFFFPWFSFLVVPGEGNFLLIMMLICSKHIAQTGGRIMDYCTWDGTTGGLENGYGNGYTVIKLDNKWAPGVW